MKVISFFAKKISRLKSEPVYEEFIPEEVSEEEKERILNKAADEIVSRRLTVPAIFFLESCSPLNFVGSQAMIAFEPFIQAIFDLPSYRKFALIMERDDNVKLLIHKIEMKNQEKKLIR